jgi:hypothetical protein
MATNNIPQGLMMNPARFLKQTVSDLGQQGARWIGADRARPASSLLAVSSPLLRRTLFPGAQEGNPWATAGIFAAPFALNYAQKHFLGENQLSLNLSDNLASKYLRDRTKLLTAQTTGIMGSVTSSADSNPVARWMQSMSGYSMGMGDVVKNFNLRSLGYVEPGLGVNDLSKDLLARNERAKQLYLGDVTSKGILKKGGRRGLLSDIFSDYAVNIDDYVGAQASDVATLASDMLKRGAADSREFQKVGSFDADVMKKNLKEATKALKSIQDVFKGDFKQMIAQMDSTFGAGYMNTFGTATAATSVGAARNVADMGGFSARDILSLNQATQSMLANVGGASFASMNNTLITGGALASTLAMDKRYIDEKRLTQSVAKRVVGAQQSERSLMTGAALAVLDSKEEREKLHNEINAYIDKNGEGPSDSWLARKAGVTTADLRGISNTNVVQEMVGTYDSATRIATKAQYNRYSDARLRTTQRVLNSRGESYSDLLKAIAKDRGLKSRAEVEKLLANTNAASLRYTSGDNAGELYMDRMAAIQVESLMESRANNNGESADEARMSYMTLENGHRLAAAAKATARAAAESQIGGNLGSNLYKVLRDGKNRSLSDGIATFFNMDKKATGKIQTKEKFMSFMKKISGGATEADTKKLLEQYSAAVDKTGLNETASQKVLEKLFVDLNASGKSLGDYIEGGGAEDLVKKAASGGLSVVTDMTSLEKDMSAYIKEKGELTVSKRKEVSRQFLKDKMLVTLENRKKLFADDEDVLKKTQKQIEALSGVTDMSLLDDVGREQGIITAGSKLDKLLGDSEANAVTDEIRELIKMIQGLITQWVQGNKESAGVTAKDTNGKLNGV